MYKHGKPIYKFSRRPLFISVGILFLLIAGGYYKFVLHGNRQSDLKNSNTPLVSTVRPSDQNTDVNEADFLFSLPGKWKLASKDWDARYHSWQWQFQDNHYAGRLFRVYEDTIPSDYAYNFLLPVEANVSGVTTGAVSGNCADFTTTAQVHKNISGTFAAVSKWQGVSFLCDYGNQSHQVVGTSSKESVNAVTLRGQKGTHTYFFLYQDNDYNPDYGVIVSILSTFHTK